jgi:hypothetical protein
MCLEIWQYFLGLCASSFISEWCCDLTSNMGEWEPSKDGHFMPSKSIETCRDVLLGCRVLREHSEWCSTTYILRLQSKQVWVSEIFRESQQLIWFYKADIVDKIVRLITPHVGQCWANENLAVWKKRSRN